MRLFVPLAASFVLLSAIISPAVPAATITVNSTADDTTAGNAQCTLREAIANVNAGADTTSGDCVAGIGSSDTITFAIAVPARIRLTSGELVINRDVTIIGPVDGSVAITGGIAGGFARRVFHINASTTIMSNLVIENGFDGLTGVGGGIAVSVGAKLTLTHCTFTNNQATAIGGGLYNGGTMVLTNCTFIANVAPIGGGIYNSDTGVMTLTNCTFSRNKSFESPGIYNNGNMSLMASTLNGNTTVVGGGARAAGAIFNDYKGIMTLTNCTLSRNRVIQRANTVAGAIYNAYGGTMTLTNCTLSNNRVIRRENTVGATGGIYNDDTGTITLTNTIVANRGSNCSGGGSVTSNGHNLSSDGTCLASGGTDLVNTDPELARLTNNGGETETMALCAAAKTPSGSCAAASPAIDAGDDAVTGPPDNLTTDQRGLPRNAGLHVDIGAYEAQ